MLFLAAWFPVWLMFISFHIISTLAPVWLRAQITSRVLYPGSQSSDHGTGLCILDPKAVYQGSYHFVSLLTSSRCSSELTESCILAHTVAQRFRSRCIPRLQSQCIRSRRGGPSSCPPQLTARLRVFLPSQAARCRHTCRQCYPSEDSAGL